MLKYGLALIAAPLALTASLPATAQQSPADNLAKISTHLRAMSTMTANFSQSSRSGQMLTGNLIIKQPGRIRFQYQKDAKMLIVGDGKALTLIDYEVNQVQRWPIRNSPLAALLNPERDLSKYGKIIPTRNPAVLSVEVSDPKRPEYGVITMVFSKKAGAPGGLSLDGWVSLDSKNNRTSIRLSNQKFGAPIANSRFNWTDPRKKRRGKR
ncbi:MAG: outer membrane lipoprotein carrier protein LolA [Parasphingorhabdus sp.]|uniref:LolA family protein n=1 Tax=Parasphingorhabdus sp. TaxID=2709688 RepID=UPI0032664CE3